MFKKLMIYEALKQAQEKPKKKLVRQVQTDVCRMCMASNVRMVGIFDCVNRNLAKDIQFCTGILVQKTGDLPKKICIDCLTQLKTAYIFKTKCIRTETKLNMQSSTVTTKLNNRIQVKKEIRKVDKAIFLPKKEKHERTTISLPTETKKASTVFLIPQRKQEKAITFLSPKEKQEKARTRSPILILKVETEGEENREEIEEEEINKNDDLSPQSIKEEVQFEAAAQIEEESPPICYICNIEFATEEDKNWHNNKDEIHKTNVYKILGRTPRSRREGKTVPEKICEICGVMMVGFQNIWRHIRMHKPPEWACDQCDYKSWFQGDLNNHRKIHSEKQYQCGYCAKMFTYSHNLHVHVRRMHENVGVKNFKCTLCNAKYATSNCLKRHSLSHLNARNFECEVCSSRFNIYKHLKRHMKNLHKIILPKQKSGRPANLNFLKTKYEDPASSAPFSEFLRNKEQ